MRNKESTLPGFWGVRGSTKAPRLHGHRKSVSQGEITPCLWASPQWWIQRGSWGAMEPPFSYGTRPLFAMLKLAQMYMMLCRLW